MKLIPEWRKAWRMYSVWAIAVLGLLGSAGDILSLLWDYLDWAPWTKALLYLAFAVAGIFSRLLIQFWRPARGDEEP
ncbi:hypothetical protein SB18R_03335 [Pseudomonas oryzihabitans]|nr:hypothetical protein SB9_12570 [Pseudomonas psychrotolerans]KTT78275.1 hypothetical protein SB18R_03335 [Pseudomonas psychrotolerans]